MSRPQPTKSAKPRRWRRIALISIIRFSLYGTLFAVGAWAGLVTSAFPELDKLESSAEFRQVPGQIVARDGKTVLRELRAPTSRTYVDADAIPKVLANAVIAAEDRRFYDHSGLDFRGITRAALVDLRARSFKEGGSTITQQLVKNAYVGPDRNLGRKTREALLAVALENRWGKDRILAAYLNTAYFGQGQYGVSDASRAYFGVTVNRLNPAQAALLAGLLRAPEANNPITARGSARTMRNTVLATMRDLDMLTDRQVRRARQSPLPKQQLLAARTRSKKEIAPHFSDSVSAQLIDKYGVRQALAGGLRVHTTLDNEMQRAANDAVTQINESGLSAALISLDVQTSEVRALALGGPAANGAFNVALQGQRQPGSAFKPFMLAAAYDAGLTPSYQVLSAPYTELLDNGKTFSVTNSSGAYTGETSIEQATHQSDNTVYSRLQQQLGIEPAIEIAKAAGIRSAIEPVPAAVLGALPQGTTPAELAHAYATFGRHGRIAGQVPGTQPSLIKRVKGSNGADNFRPKIANRQAIPRPVADQVTETLLGVISQGTGSRADIGVPAAGKTGTTDNNADAWFVGYTPHLVTAVWVGNVAGAVPMRDQYNGGPVYGGTFPAEIWAQYMQEAVTIDATERNGSTTATFSLEQPDYVRAVIDPESGLLAGPWCADRQTTTFVAGDAPTTISQSCDSRARETPQLIGRALDDASELLESQDFAFEATDQLVAQASQVDVVVDQSPLPGEPVERDQIIELIYGRQPFSE